MIVNTCLKFRMNSLLAIIPPDFGLHGLLTQHYFICYHISFLSLHSKPVFIRFALPSIYVPSNRKNIVQPLYSFSIATLFHKLPPITWCKI